jgi:hypothetical protein
MAYNPDIVSGVWVGNTAPNGGGGLIHAYGENVGLTIMKRFVNALPSSMRDWYSRPAGVTVGCGHDSQDPFLQGACTQPTPSATTSPSASPSESPSILPSVLPSILPSASASASPSPSPQPSPSPSAAAPSPT